MRITSEDLAGLDLNKREDEKKAVNRCLSRRILNAKEEIKCLEFVQQVWPLIDALPQSGQHYTMRCIIEDLSSQDWTGILARLDTYLKDWSREERSKISDLIDKFSKRK